MFFWKGMNITRHSTTTAEYHLAAVPVLRHGDGKVPFASRKLEFCIPRQQLHGPMYPLTTLLGFPQVPMPRAALKDLANARGLKTAKAEANSDRGAEDRVDGDEVDGVELWADWPCSCVRLRGEPAMVRRAVRRSE